MNSRTIGSGSYADNTSTTTASKSTSMSSTAATSSSTTTTSSSAGATLPSGQAQQRQSDQVYQALRRRRRAEQQRQRESKANSRMANSAPQPPSSSISQSLPPSPPKPQPQEVVQSQIPLQQPTSSTSTPQRNQSSTTPLSKSYKTTTTIKRLDKFGFVINEEKINDVIFDARSNSSSSSPHGPHLGPPPSTPPRPPTTPKSTTKKKQKQTKSQKKLTKKALHQKRLEQHKIQKWQAMMADWSTYTRTTTSSQEKGLAKKKLRHRARRGVPDHIRGDAWILLGAVRDRVKKDKVYQNLIDASSKTLLHSYSSVEEMGGEGDEYSGCSSVMDTIERDINRTFPRHYLFMRDDDDESSSSEISSSSSESESESSFLSEDVENSILEEEENQEKRREEEEVMEENASVEVGDDGVPTWIEPSTTTTLVKHEIAKDEHDNEKLKENDVESEENGLDQNDCNKDDIATPKTPTQAEITKNKDTTQPNQNESSNSNSQTSTSTSEPTPAERFHSVMERVKMIEERSKSSKTKKGQHSRNNSLDSFVSKSSYASSNVKSPVRSSIAKFERGTVSKVEKKKEEEEELLVGFGEKEKEEEEEEYKELLVGFGGSKNNTTRTSVAPATAIKSGEEKEEICAIPEEALVGDDGEDGKRGGIPTWVESRSMSKDDLHKEGLGMVGSGGGGGMEEIETGLMAPSTTEPNKNDEEKHSKQKNAQRNNSKTKKDSGLLMGFRGERNSSTIPPSSPPKKSNHDTSISTSSTTTTTTNKLSKEQKKRLKKEQNYAVAKGGQASLRRVLRAYSIYDKEVGYCQGMNFIAAMFITFMEEEEAFWMLVYVMNDPPCRMRGLFGEAMTESHQVLYIAEKLISQFLPKLSSHLNKEGVHITMFATQWLLTLYTSSFPFDLVTRVWDCFLAEGWKIIYRVMLAILDMSSKDLLGMGFEGMLGYFRNLPSRVDGEKVLEVALKVPLKRKHIEKYKKEFRKANNHQS